MSTSADLTWLLTRTYHSKLVKRTGSKKAFSAEAGNLANVHTFHNSGLIHPKTIDIRPAKEGKGVVVLSRKGDAPLSHVAKAVESKDYTGGKSTRQTLKAVGEQAQGYRAERKSLAVARARGVLASQGKSKTSKAPRVRSSRDKKASAAKSA